MVNSETLQMQHSSLQYSDGTLQQKVDIHDLFRFGRYYPIKTGTEAGPENMNHDWLKEYADKFNHNLQFGTDCWIAVDRKIISEGSFRRGKIFIADNSETWGKGHDTVMPTVEFDHEDPRIGHLSVGAVHYPLRGARPGDVNHDINMRAAQKINEWMRLQGRGTSLAFVNGDFNMPDDRTDWAFEGNWTSMADELNAWENTGHGPIDGFCSYDRDGRVSAKSFEVLTDKEFFQFGDHFVCRGVWEIRHKK